MINNVAKMTDKALLKLCKYYGKNVLIWNHRFGSLLPEIFKRRLYKRAGCCSIHEFAAKTAGMGRETVDRILNLDRELIDKPVLKGLIPEFGWSKVQIVASIATKETDGIWAEKIKLMPKSSLVAYVKECRKLGEVDLAGDLTGPMSENQQNLTCISVLENEIEPEKQKENVMWNNISFPVDPETEFKLRELKQKLEKDRRQPVTFNEVIKYMFQKLDQKLEVATGEQKEAEYTKERTEEFTQLPAKSRYIPAKTRYLLEEKYHHRCAYPGCNMPFQVLHHTERFADAKNHDATKIVPFCKRHHDIAHAELIANERQSVSEWGVNLGRPILSWSDVARQKFLLQAVSPFCRHRENGL